MDRHVLTHSFPPRRMYELGPVPGMNPVGDCCAIIDFIDRQPFALLMNTATGTVLVLPARAADLKRLHAMAAEQLGGMLQACGIGGALAEAELGALREPFGFARNGNRSLVASMNQRRHEAWTQFAYNRLTAFDVALRMLETPFSREDLGRGFHFAANLLPARLLPATQLVASGSARGLH